MSVASFRLDGKNLRERISLQMINALKGRRLSNTFLSHLAKAVHAGPSVIRVSEGNSEIKNLNAWKEQDDSRFVLCIPDSFEDLTSAEAWKDAETDLGFTPEIYISLESLRAGANTKEVRGIVGAQCWDNQGNPLALVFSGGVVDAVVNVASGHVVTPWWNWQVVDGAPWHPTVAIPEHRITSNLCDFAYRESSNGGEA